MKHETAPAPSLLIALVALCLVHRFCPAWAAITVRGAAESHGVNPERVSRLATGALGRWEAVLAELTARGRPRQQPSQDAELGLLRALLSVATQLHAQTARRAPGFRPQAVGAWLRLRAEHPALTQQRFCRSLALSPRTFRAWLSAPAAAADADAGSVPAQSSSPPDPAPPQRARRLGRRRFGFDVVVPGTQLAADTTDLEVCGVPLKLIATQDIGGRDASLLETVIVDDHESAALVVEALDAALAGRQGMQVIVDQGTPYMAQLTRDALDQLGAEHAPQPEGTPTAKATIERAFLTVKQIAGPVFALTSSLASRVPALRDSHLARAIARLTLTLLLKSYQSGARATHAAEQARGAVASVDLAAVAATARDQARALDESRRLLLAHINELYHLGANTGDFIRKFRGYSLEVLGDAERRLRSQLHRDDIRNWSRYFGAIVRTVADEHRSRRLHQVRTDHTAARLEHEQRERAGVHAARQQNPIGWLREALDLIAMGWQPANNALLFGGIGLGTGWLSASLDLLRRRYSECAVQDLVSGVLADFALAHRDRLGDAGLAAVTALVRRELPALPPLARAPTSPVSGSSATLWNTGRTRRPPDQRALPI